MTTNADIDFVTFISSLWRGRLIVIGTLAICLGLSVAYATLAPEWYRAEVLLAPAHDDDSSGLFAQMGGLASLAGLNSESERSVESLAILRSQDFAKEFIEELNLLPVFWADIWDSQSESWSVTDPEDIPDVRDGIKYFDEQIRIVSEEVQTGLVRLSIEWKDPDLAADWANSLVNRLNKKMRERALAEAERNVEYLRNEMRTNDILQMEQSIARLLESELQKLMLARGSEEFSYKVLDPALTPIEPIRPRRLLAVLLGAIAGLMIGSIAVLMLDRYRANSGS
jgi:uncharacterized protein involved in exopolysaccharide biosynthesis